jgi:hypothetical protein
MRDDMRRVIITRGRFFDPNCQPRKGRRKPLEELPTKRSMRRDYNESWGRKSLNDYLSPLRRYLAKQVGRPWDKVYSEICQKAGAKGTINNHLRKHVFDFVIVKPRRQSCSWRDKNGVRQHTTRLWWQPFYVDERDGILKRTDKLPEAKARRAGKR